MIEWPCSPALEPREISPRAGLRAAGALGLALWAGVTLATAGWAEVLFYVDSTLDQVDDDTADGVCHTAAGTCTLRAAVMQANRTSGAGAIIVLAAGTYDLTRPAAGVNGDDNGDLNLTPPLAGDPYISISGAGPSSTIIDAHQIDRLLYVHPGRKAKLTGITLRNGLAVSDGGGGILNSGELTIRQCVLSGNSNVSTRGGGGIYTPGILFVQSSTIRGNSSTIIGGGIYAPGQVDIGASTISGNSASFGGGIFMGAGSSLYLSNSTIVANDATGDGGGMYSRGATRIYNSTIAFNQADSDGDFLGQAGGIFHDEEFEPQPFSLLNSVVAGNYLSGAPVYDDCQGGLNSYGRNQFGTIPAQCTVTQVGAGGYALLGSLAELGSLQSHGGDTETVAIIAPSSLIDGAEPTLGCQDRFGDPLLTDQRGGPRTAGAFCDIGAFESGALPDGLIFADGFESATSHAW